MQRSNFIEDTLITVAQRRLALPLSESLPDRELVRLRAGFRRRSSLPLERDDELERESELDSESESESDESELDELESESELESEPEEDDDRFCFFFALLLSSFSFTAARSFSFAASILSAVPLFVLNSSGTSTLGFPDACSFASSFGFSNCCVRDGRETYGLEFLHSNV